MGPFSSSWACVGLRGLSWASSGPMRGVVDVVQPADVLTNLRNGPNDGVVWALFCLRWPALGAVGLRWPALAFVGLRWPSLAVVGCCGPSWAVVITIKIKFCTLKKDLPTRGPNDAVWRRLGPFWSTCVSGVAF